jgi:hypothetical protein
MYIGAIRIRGGEVTFMTVSFISNVMQSFNGFPNLRHNVFVSNGAVVSVFDPRADTNSSNFIYLSNVGGVPSVNLNSPMFVPSVKSASPTSFPDGTLFTLTLTGESFYPCGLQLNIYRNNTSNLLQV